MLVISNWPLTMHLFDFEITSTRSITPWTVFQLVQLLLLIAVYPRLLVNKHDILGYLRNQLIGPSPLFGLKVQRQKSSAGIDYKRLLQSEGEAVRYTSWWETWAGEHWGSVQCLTSLTHLSLMALLFIPQWSWKPADWLDTDDPLGFP